MFKDYNEFAKTLNSAMSGSITSKAQIQEAVTTSSFPHFMHKGFEPLVIAAYQNLAPIWEQISTKHTMTSFRKEALTEYFFDEKTLIMDNGVKVVPANTLPEVPELAHYPAFEYLDRGYILSIAKHGAVFGLSFEAIINGQWNLVKDFPKVAGFLARNTEDFNIIKNLYSMNDSTLNPDVFNEDNENLITPGKSLINTDVNIPVDAELNLFSLSEAIRQLKSPKKDTNRYYPDNLVLLVPPELEDMAKAILNIREFKHKVGEIEYTSNSPVSSNIKVISNATIGRVSGGKAWMLLPANGVYNGINKAITTNFMVNRERPELRVEDATGKYLSGGEVNFKEGSFDNDDAKMRVRHIVGASIVEPRAFIGSKGTNPVQFPK